jgi:hypothetical protein
MGLSTKDLKGEAKKPSTVREKIQELQKKHASLFEKESIQHPKFVPRMCYKHTSGDMIVGFYEKELRGGKDIYTEFCSRNYNSENPILWKWVFNPEYATEYEKSEPHPSTGDRRYLIPADELININDLYKEKETEEPLTLLPEMGAGEDVPYDSMTLRDHAAIQWQKPVSGKKWLNELITNTFK